jgi:hypothetical protein
MTRDRLQAALDRFDEAEADEPHYEALETVINAAHAYLRLLPLNGQWDETTVELIAATLAETSDPLGEPNDVWREVARAVLSALVEEG